MKYLFIGAHPDDIEFSCGGTVLRLVNEGHKVFMLVLCGGGASINGSETERRIEQERAFSFSGAKELQILDFKDGEIKATAQSIQKISDIISNIKPDFVVTHFPDDSHQDHREVAAIVKSATRRKYSLLYFDSYSSMNFKANLYINITPYASGKKKLIRKHYSQIIKYHERGIDFIKKSLLINRLNGYECDAVFAEAFAIDTYII